MIVIKGDSRLVRAIGFLREVWRDMNKMAGTLFTGTVAYVAIFHGMDFSQTPNPFCLFAFVVAWYFLTWTRVEFREFTIGVPTDPDPSKDPHDG